MHATDILDTCVSELCQTMHLSRYHAVKAAVSSALNHRCVTVTGLGRGIAGDVQEKHSIKRMDRLVGNRYLRTEAPAVYRSMSRWLVNSATRPLILVDWSPLSPDQRFYLLRASIPLGGRALVIYEEAHEQRDHGGHQVHVAFLRQLALILPETCRPVLITDAGFKNPWFRAVEAMGWDWIGRIRGRVQVSRPGEDKWLFSTLLTKLLPSGRSMYLGRFDLARANPIECAIYGLRKVKKGRVSKTRKGLRSRSEHNRVNAARGRDPWLIATSLAGGDTETKRILAAYQKRMQIEENFRDTKSEYYGLGLDRSRSRSAGRYTVLLLVNALAIFTAWLFGTAARLEKLHRRYQANTVRHRTVLSSVFLGLRVIRRQDLQMTTRMLAQIRRALHEPDSAMLA